MAHLNPLQQFSSSSACHVCYATARELFCKGSYAIFGCAVCGYQFAKLESSSNHVTQVYGDDYFFGGGSGYPDYLKQSQLLREHGRRYGLMLREYMEPGTVLDVGAAAGFLLQGLVDMGWRGTGIEPNATMVKHATQSLGLDLRVSSIEEFHTSERFDLICMIQVMGHFVDPVSALAAAAELTRPDGWWVIETWNPKSITARVFGKWWHEYCPPTAIRWFPPETLALLASQFGFKEVTRGKVRKRLKGDHAKAVLRHNLSGTTARLLSGVVDLLPNRVTLPYPAEDLYWSLYRRS